MGNTHGARASGKRPAAPVQPAGTVVAESKGATYVVETLREMPGVPPVLLLRVDSECLTFLDPETRAVLRSLSYHVIICWGYTATTFQLKTVRMGGKGSGAHPAIEGGADGSVDVATHSAAASTPAAAAGGAAAAAAKSASLPRTSSRWRDQMAAGPASGPDGGAAGAGAAGAAGGSSGSAGGAHQRAGDAAVTALDRVGAFGGQRSVAVDAALMHDEEGGDAPFGVIPTLAPDGVAPAPAPAAGARAAAAGDGPAGAGAVDGRAGRAADAGAKEGKQEGEGKEGEGKAEDSDDDAAAEARRRGESGADTLEGVLRGKVETFVMLTGEGVAIEAEVMAAVRRLMSQMDSRGVSDDEFATLIATLNSLAEGGEELGDAQAITAVRQMAVTRGFDARQAVQLVTAIGTLSPFSRWRLP